MAVMADFARLPTRQKAMLFFVIAVVLGLVYWQFMFKKLKENVAIEESQHAQKLAQNQKYEKDIPEFAKLKARMTTLTRLIQENEKALPTEAELPAFFDMLNRKVLESGVEVIHVTQQKEAPVDTFIKVPVSYEIQGSFLQIKKFFASLLPKKKRAGDVSVPGQPEEVEEKERIVSVENLSLSNPVVRNREIKLTAKFVVSTYRQDEKTEAPAAKGGKPGAAPAGGNSPASAGTPKGAKDATEKAIDKGDQRNKNADPSKMKGGVP